MVPDVPLKWCVLCVNVLCVMALAFNTTAMMNALPSLQQDLDLSPIAARWAINSYILAGAATVLLAGSLGDLLGHFRMQLLGVLFFGVTSLGIAFCHTGGELLLLRSAQGMAAAIISALALSSMSYVFPLSQRSFALSIWGGMVGLGFGLGPLLGGILVTYLGWRSIFLGMTGVMALGVVGNIIFMWRYPHRAQKLRLDVLGLIFFVGWVVLFVTLVMEGSRLSPMTWMIAGIGATVLFLFFVERMRRSPEPFMDLTLLQRPALLGSTLIFFVTIFSLILFLNFYNRFLQWPLLYGATPWQAGLWMLPLNVAMFSTALGAPYFKRLLGDSCLLTIGMLLLSIGFGTLALFPHLPIGFSQTAILILLGGGFGWTFPLAPQVGLHALPLALQGKGSGILNTANYLAGSLAISVGALVYVRASQCLLPDCDTAMRDLALLGAHREVLSVPLNPEALKLAACRSFSMLMFLAATVCLGGLVTCRLFIKTKIDCISKTE